MEFGIAMYTSSPFQEGLDTFGGKSHEDIIFRFINIYVNGND